MLKKFFLILTLLLLSLKPTYAAFSDVQNDYIYKDAIDYVQEQGIVNGYSDGTFRPDNPIKRGEFTKIIVNATHSQDEVVNCKDVSEDTNGVNKYAEISDVGVTYRNLFPDIVGGDVGGSTQSRIKATQECDKYDDINNTPWECIEEYSGIENKFYDYVCVAKEESIVSGYSDGTFRPDANITVGEASKIIANAFGLTNETSLKIDLAEKFKSYVDSLYEIKALPDDLGFINSFVNRGQTAEIIWRIEEKVIDKTSLSYDNLLGFDNYYFDLYNEKLKIHYPIDWKLELLDNDSWWENLKFIKGKNTIFVGNGSGELVKCVYDQKALQDVQNTPLDWAWSQSYTEIQNSKMNVSFRVTAKEIDEYGYNYFVCSDYFMRYSDKSINDFLINTPVFIHGYVDFSDKKILEEIKMIISDLEIIDN